MHAMILEQPGQPLREADLPQPRPGPGQILLRVHACGVCRTDLHVLDGELTEPKLPLVLGHEIVGTVVEKGEQVERFAVGERVGVPWLGWTCGTCPFCQSQRENLCDRARFTGYQIDGGYAEYTLADQRVRLRPARRLRRCGGGPSALCRADRLSLPGHGGRASTPGPLWLWCRGPPHCPGSATSGARSLRLHPARRHRRTTIRTHAGSRVGRQLGSAAARGDGCRSSVRSSRVPRPAGAAGGGQGGNGGVRGDPHERHSLFSVSPSVGRAKSLFGGQPDAAGWRGIPGVGPSGACPHRR